MQKGLYLSTLLRSNMSVFSVTDIMLLWNETKAETARTRINYYVKAGELLQVRRGIYAKNNKYNRLELGTKYLLPPTLALKQYLEKLALHFKIYTQIKLASYLSRDLSIGDQTYSYKKIKSEILTNHIGVEIKDDYSIATPERAFLDVLYLNKSYHFDNLSILNWSKVEEILPIYGNKRLENTITRYKKQNI
jgi:hypothetical protein